MVIFFPEKNPETIVESLKGVMGGRELAKIVSFDVSNDQMTVTISKLGTSTLHFKRQETEDGSQFSLNKEKIALSHKPMKGEVKSKIYKVIEKAGGKISET
jgi:hypothetical protein